VKSRFSAFFAINFPQTACLISPKGLKSKKIQVFRNFFSFFYADSKKGHIFVSQTRREKIGCETGSSKFQLLEKDY